MKEPVIRIVDLCFRFPDGTRVLEGVNLSVRRRTLHLLAGPNGSGKTVLMKQCNGLLKPESGAVLLNGVSIRKDIRGAREKIGLVFQDADAQIVGQTVARDIAFGLINLGLPRKTVAERTAAVLDAMRLTALAEHNPHTLSGGEKRRLAIAGVVAMDPEILILDEPFSNLDWEGVRMVLGTLLELKQRGHTILLITHDLEKIIGHADTMSILNDGRIVADGAPGELIDCVGEYGIRPPWGTPRALDTMTWL